MESIVAKTANALAPFGRAERSIAAFCMGIPFILIVADRPDPRWWVNAIFLAGACFLLLPPILALYDYLEKKTADAAAFWTTIAAGFILWLAYMAISQSYTIRPSISQYVDMRDSHLFGLLLTIPGMLFIVNGYVYSNTVEAMGTKRNGLRRSTLNVLAGIALLGVVLVPYHWVKFIHYGCAIIFYLFSAIVIWKGMGSGKDPKTSRGSVIVMGVVMVIGVVNHFGIADLGKDFITLFGAESLGLWIIGVHYIIVSSERIEALAGRTSPVPG